MNYDRLALFLHIVDTGSVTAAARRAHLTQPAVTRNLKALESDLDLQLFERRGRGLVLTPAGRSLVPEARELLERTDRIKRRIARTAERGYFDLRLGTVDSVATYLLPELVAPLRERFRGLGLKLFTARTASLLEQIETERLDLAIVASSGAPEGRATRICSYDLQFWGRRDLYPTLTDVVDERDLSAFPIVQIEAGPGQPTLISDDAHSFAIANSLASVKSLVLAGFGVGALLNFMINPNERETLVHAAVPHDPECALYLLAAKHWEPRRHDAITQTIVESLTRGPARERPPMR
ncbi:MAG: LysR family transcriptional regulator [Myxococcales bacterium]|nr:LysR family transcriptional regulator [Myxococcales bacterium]